MGRTYLNPLGGSLLPGSHEALALGSLWWWGSLPLGCILIYQE